MTAPPVVFTAGGVMISGLSLTIRDKRPTPRELFWRVLSSSAFNKSHTGRNTAKQGFYSPLYQPLAILLFSSHFCPAFRPHPPQKTVFSLFNAVQILTSRISDITALQRTTRCRAILPILMRSCSYLLLKTTSVHCYSDINSATAFLISSP